MKCRGGGGDERTSEARDVGQPAGDCPNLVESIEQHGCRVPLTADERVAQGRGQCRHDPECAGRDEARVDVGLDERGGAFSMSVCSESTAA